MGQWYKTLGWILVLVVGGSLFLDAHRVHTVLRVLYIWYSQKALFIISIYTRHARQRTGHMRPWKYEPLQPHSQYRNSFE